MVSLQKFDFTKNLLEIKLLIFFLLLFVFWSDFTDAAHCDCELDWVVILSYEVILRRKIFVVLILIFLDESIGSGYSAVPDSILEIESREIEILKVKWEFNGGIKLTL